MRTTAALLPVVMEVRVLTPSITLPSISTAAESIFIQDQELSTEAMALTSSRHCTVVILRLKLL